MIPRNYYQLSALALLVLGLSFSGCSRKADDNSALISATKAPAEQSEAEKQAVRAHGPKQSELAKGSEEAPAALGEQGQAKSTDPAPATDSISQQPAVAPAVASVQNYTLRAGSRIVVRSITSLSTKTASAGDRFEASLEQPLIVGEHMIAPKGTSVFGQVTVSDPSGKLKGSSYLGVQLTTIALPNGNRVAIQTATNATISKGTGKKTGAKVGIGAGLGALLGAIAGGGRGAAIGAGAGSAAGAGVAYATGGNPAIIASESVLTFQLAAPVTIASRD